MGIGVVVGQVGAAYVSLLDERAPAPLEGIMEAFSDVKEALVAVDDLPVSLYPQATQQGDVGVEKLGHPTAEGGGVDMAETKAFELPGQFPDLIDGLIPHDETIFVYVFEPQGYLLKHWRISS